MAKLTQAEAVLWAIKILEMLEGGGSLPSWAPSRQEVIEGLGNVKEHYEMIRRSGRRLRTDEPVSR
jgi:hypothetical protein